MDFLESSDEEECYDEDRIYEAIHEDLVPSVPRLDLSLYRQPTTTREGAVKAHYKGGGCGELIYSKDSADYRLTVERLVWVDRWRRTTKDEGHKTRHDDMTLVVLKFAFATKTPDSKVAFARTELRFKSQDKKGKDPEVVAWGPFHRPETWNPSSAQRKTNVKGEGKLGTDQLSLSVAGDNETSWDRIDFDRGKSKKLFSLNKEEATPNGVSWKLEQNKLHKQGITPEFRVAVLLKRSSTFDPYLVDLRLVAHTGTISALTNKVVNRLGLPGGHSHYWCATPQPGEKTNCHAEGLHIIHSIDIDNLGKLVSDPSDNQNLNPPWLNTWDRFEVPKIKSDESGPESRNVRGAMNVELAAVGAPSTSAAAAVDGLEGGLHGT